MNERIVVRGVVDAESLHLDVRSELHNGDQEGLGDIAFHRRYLIVRPDHS